MVKRETVQLRDGRRHADFTGLPISRCANHGEAQVARAVRRGASAANLTLPAVIR
jgi:hypothetical protein